MDVELQCRQKDQQAETEHMNFWTGKQSSFV